MFGFSYKKGARIKYSHELKQMQIKGSPWPACSDILISKVCMAHVFVWVSISLSLISFCIGLCVVRVFMTLAFTSVMYGFLYWPSFNVSWSHFRYVWLSILSEFLCHLVSLPFCVGLYVVWFSMSRGLTSVLYVFLCCPSFYVTWSHFRSVWVFMLSEFLSHLVLPPLCIGPCVVWACCLFDRTFQENFLRVTCIFLIIINVDNL
jgi:hypothetical protein